MPKPRREEKAVHRHGLAEDMTNPWKNGVRMKPRSQKRKMHAEEGEEDEGITENLSKKILQEAQAQQVEVEAEEAGEEANLIGAAVDLSGQGVMAATKKAKKARKGGDFDSDDDSDFDDDDYSDTQSQWDLEEVEVTEEDERAIQAFMRPNAPSTRTLADIIMDKIREKQEEVGVESGGLPGEDGEPLVPAGLDPKVIHVYQGVAKLLKRYSSGKVPKAFKILPKLSNWEEILYLTEPEEWSVHACYQATRLFVSSLNAKMAQRFLALVLLPRIRADIEENKRLHFALFQAMRKATYKPGAFYKGLLLPLCQAGDCTLREAVIFAAVLKRVSIPVLHSAAALMRMAEMEYLGTNSFFILQLLDKKYALPYRVIDAMVDHFVRFEKDERQLPVIWHQSLLTFVQRYKNEIRKEDKEALRKLLKIQAHYLVTPEVFRELDYSRNRGEKGDAPVSMDMQAQFSGHGREDPNDMPPVLLMEED